MSGTTKITTKQLNINNNLDLQNNSLKNGGFEVVTSLPTTNLFVGRQVCYQGKDYVYDGTAWKNDADTLGGYNISNFYGNFESSVLPILNRQRTNIDDPSVFEAAVIDSQFTNKVWFFPISYTTFERSTDDITYNIASDITDDQKRGLFGGAGNTEAHISIPKGQYLRITLDSPSYWSLNMLYLWYANRGDKSYIKIEKYSLNTASWSNVIGYQSFGSWPAHTVVRHPVLSFANYNTTSHFSRVRITIKVDADTSGGVYTDHILDNIEWYGGYPAGRRTIYSNDKYQNVYFPAAVQSNETINCDINTIAPTQTGKVTKTSTWWWQYLTQCVHFLYASIRYLSNGYLPRWNSTTQRLENSKLYDNGTNVGIGTTSPTEALDVVGSIKSSAFINSTSDNTYTLLGGGGTELLKDLSKEIPAFSSQSSDINTTVSNGGFFTINNNLYKKLSDNKYFNTSQNYDFYYTNTSRGWKRIFTSDVEKSYIVTINNAYNTIPTNSLIFYVGINSYSSASRYNDFNISKLGGTAGCYTQIRVVRLTLKTYAVEIYVSGGGNSNNVIYINLKLNNTGPYYNNPTLCYTETPGTTDDALIVSGSTASSVKTVTLNTYYDYGINNEYISGDNIYGGTVKSNNGFIYNGKDDNYYLKAGGGTGLISDLATSASLNGYLPLTGGTLTGDLNVNTGNLDLRGNQIKNAAIEVVTSLPATGNFTGRQVTYQGRCYIWNGSAWKCDSDYLEIGGRNYISNSSKETKTVSWSGWDYILFDRLLTAVNLKPGDEIVLRFYVQNTDAEVRAFLLTFNENSQYIQTMQGSTVSPGESGYSTIKWEIPETISGLSPVRLTATIRQANPTQTATVTYSQAKLEKGNIATDWSPAPEDKANENQTINFDTSNIEPTQFGTVTKTSTWLWQYLTQSINYTWLKLKTWVGGLFSAGSVTTNDNYLPKIDDVNKKLVKSNISDDGTTPKYNTNTIWYSGNDGSGSGLDADLLDGKHASDFATSTHNHASTYLGITATAADSDKLDGKHASDFAQLESGKILEGNLPDYIFGQVLFGGFIAINTSTNKLVCTLSAKFKSKYNITENTLLLENMPASNYEGVYFMAINSWNTQPNDGQVGDWIISNGITWSKVDNSDAVSSVNGQTGVVNLGYEDLGDMPVATDTKVGGIKLGFTQGLNADLLDDKHASDFALSSHTHTKSQITDLTVDAALSSISTNPVQNKIVNTAINSKFSTSGGLISGNVQINPNSAGYSEGIRIANAPNNYSAIILGCDTSYGYTGTNVGMWAINKNSNNTLSIKYCTSAGSALSEGLTLNPDGDATWKGNTLACLGNIPVGGTNQAFPVADIGSILTDSVYNYFFDIGDNTFSLDLTSSTTLKNIAIGQLYNIYFNSITECNIEFRDTLLNVTLKLTSGKRVKCEVLKISSSRAELVYYTIN